MKREALGFSIRSLFHL